jgi:hypothetical protein
MRAQTLENKAFSREARALNRRALARGERCEQRRREEHARDPLDFPCNL